MAKNADEPEIFQGIDDREFLTMKYSPTCFFCKHLQEANPVTRHCAAFPEPGSIPLRVWNGDDDHLKPIQGDGGITREERSKSVGPAPYTPEKE